MLASVTRRRSGDDLVVTLVKHGYAPSRTTSNIGTWDCGRPGTEFMTEISGVISWKRRRSCRGMLHDNDDDDDDDDDDAVGLNQCSENYVQQYYDCAASNVYNKYEKKLYIRNWHTLLHRLPTDASCSLTRWQHFSVMKIVHFTYPSLIRRPRSPCSLWNFAAKLTVRKLESWGYPTVKTA